MHSYKCDINRLNRFEEEFVKCCNHLVKVGLEEREKRLTEVTDFREAHREACSLNQKASVERLREFEELKQEVIGGSLSLAALLRLQAH